MSADKKVGSTHTQCRTADTPNKLQTYAVEEWSECADVTLCRSEEDRKAVEAEAERRKTVCEEMIKDVLKHACDPDAIFPDEDGASYASLCRDRERWCRRPRQTGSKLKDAPKDHYAITSGVFSRLSISHFLPGLSALFALPAGSRYFKHLVSVERVPVGFQVPSLVGQWGVKASTWLTAGTALGVYEGRTYKDGDAPPSDYRLWWAYTTFDGERKLEFVVDAVKPWSNGAMERINDYRVDVAVGGKTPPNDPRKVNCRWVTVTRNGEPFQVVVTSKFVPSGAWLLHDYGESYWLDAKPNPKNQQRITSSL